MSPVPSSRAEHGFHAHATALALAIAGLGLLARLVAARGAFLSPDELLHLEIARAPGLLETYRVSLDNAHPPLFALLLRFWARVAGSEWQLRLLPIAFGTAFLWAAYRWVVSLFGKGPALLALALLSFLPAFVLLSTEVRSYSLMLFLVAAALASLERAFEKASPRWFGVFTAFAGLAMLSHYAALRLAAAAAVYAAVRMRLERPQGPFVRAWVASQVALAAECLFLYASHLSRLHGGAMERLAQAVWLRESYLQPGESPARFLLRQTLAVFQFVFSARTAGLAALLLAAAAVVWLARNGRPAALLLAAPFALAAAAGLLRLYPYAGTRHSIDLGLFACAAVGLALSPLTRNWPWLLIVLILLLAPAAFALALA